MRNGSTTLTLSEDARRALKRLIANRNTPAKVVWRAQIVLATARGLGTGAIRQETGKDKTTIWRWQQRYQEEGESFKSSYINILSTGGSKSPATILTDAGIDIHQADFWQGGFDNIENLVEKLEKLPLA